MSQNDLSIANQGFASFRSDLNSALQALGSTNSGTSAPSTTYANQLFYDTTNNILKIRNEDNDAFISLFTLDQGNDNIASLSIDGTLKFGASGSETGQIEINSTALLLRTTGDKSGLRFDTSAYTPFKNGSTADGTVDLGFASGRFKDLYLSNSVKIATATNGTALLDLGDTDDVNIGRIGYDNSDNSMRFTTNTSERMRINSSGTVLINKSADNETDAGVILSSGGNSFVRSGGSATVMFNRLSSHGVVLLIKKDGTSVGSIDSNSGNLLIRTDGNKSGVRFDTASVTPFKNGSEADGTIDLGFASGRYGQLFAVAGSINTSDKTEKQDIETFTDAEMKVAKKVSALFKKYRWKTAVAEKGESARVHSGVISQEVQTAFKEEGLDASKYGLWCSDTWWEETEKFTDDDGEEKTRRNTYRTKEEAPNGATEKTRLGIRYAELISFICAYNEQRFASIEARLTALEAK